MPKKQAAPTLAGRENPQLLARPRQFDAAGCHKAYERGDRRGCAALLGAGLEKISRDGLPAELAGFSDLLDRLIVLMRLRETGPTELPSAPALPASPAGAAPPTSDGTPEGLTSA